MTVQELINELQAKIIAGEIFGNSEIEIESSGGEYNPGTIERIASGPNGKYVILES